MRKTLSRLAAPLLVSLALASPQAMAAEGYVGLGGGVADHTADGLDTSTAGRIHGGLMLLDGWAVELGYMDFGEFDADRPGGASVETSGAYLALAGVSPVSETVELTGKVGAFFFDQDVKAGGATRSSDGTSPFLGIGMRVYVTPAVALGVEVNHVNDVEDDHINAVFVQVHARLGPGN